MKFKRKKKYFIQNEIAQNFVQFHIQKCFYYYYYHLASVDLDQEMRPGSVFDASTSTTDPSRKGYFMDYENKRPKRPKLRPPPPRGGPQVYGGKGNNNRRREPNRRTQNDNIPGWRKFLPNLPSLPDLLSLRDTVFPNKRNDRPPPLPPKIPPRPQNSIRTSNRPNLQQQQHHHNPLKRPPLLTSLNSFEQTSSEDLPPIGKNHALNM